MEDSQRRREVSHHGILVSRDVPGIPVLEDARIARAERAFETKYGWQIHLFNFFSKLAGKYPKRAWLELTL